MHIGPPSNHSVLIKRLGLAAAFFALLLAPLPSAAAGYKSVQKLIGGGWPTGNHFGSAVAVSGDTAVVGAPNHDITGYTDDGVGHGLASVYRYDDESGWVRAKQLTASNAGSGDNFGSSVAISGDWIVVGAVGAGGTGAVYAYRQNGESWEEEILTASDAAADDRFGAAVAVSGNTIVVGAPWDDDNGDRSGSAYVFRYDDTLGWVEEDDKLTPSSGAAAYDDFGSSVAISGETLVVGAPSQNSTTLGTSGEAYVFRHNGTSWVQDPALSDPDGAVDDLFGTSVAVSGDAIAVAAKGAAFFYRHDGSWVQKDEFPANGYQVAISGDMAVVGNNTSAYVLWYDGQSWVEEAELIAAAGTDGIVRAVAISGFTAFIGTPFYKDDLVPSSGAAYIYQLPSARPEAKLLADDGDSRDDFGAAVSVSGDTALVGSPQDDDLGNVSGSAYLFWYDGEFWTSEDKLLPSDGAGDDRFGTSVALDGSLALIGAPGSGSIDIGEDDILYGPGAAYVFRYSGATWSQEERLTPAGRTPGAGEDLFGYSVAISGNTVVVGAPWDGWVDGGEWVYGSGAAYVFWYDGVSWVPQGKLTAGDGQPEDEFGSSVSISGDTIVVGAHYEDEKGDAAGAAYVFQYSEGSWIPDGKLSATDGEADDEFGGSVAVASDTILVGAKRDGDKADDAGAAYVFGYDGEGWVEETKLTASDGMLNARFGVSVAISAANTIAIGAENHDATGSAYVFWHDGVSWVEDPKLMAPGYFGASVAISGDTVTVGAPFNGDNGAAFIYTVRYIPEPSLLALNMAALAALAFVARWRALPQRGSRKH